MRQGEIHVLAPVDCRIGSLETMPVYGVPGLVVDCRIGSLETMLPQKAIGDKVDCRIGSLESAGFR